MYKIFNNAFLSIIMFCLVAGSAFATAPGEEVNPNGFPSGSHYNLNIIGKKDTFTCPAQLCDYVLDPTCVPNVVFIPAYGNDIKILMESGTKRSSITQLNVTDWCTKPFDSDEAVVQIPPATYNVYARALAKPTYDPNIAILGNSVSYVTDENGNDLYYLGSFSKECGVTTPDIPECSFTRTKGKSRATDITGLFEFTGDICYFDPIGYCDPSTTCPPTTLCCDLGGDPAVYSNCEIKDAAALDCGTKVEVTGYCKDYSSNPTSFFTVADFTGYLWSLDNNGVKLLQVRFYPQ